MKQPGTEDFVRRALEEFQRRGAAGEALDVEAFAREQAAGDGEREAALARALAAALAGSEATLPLPPSAPPGAAGEGRLIDGRYRVERELGEGGFGVVYLVRDELFGGARRALKTLRPHLTQDPGVAQRFRNEMVVVKALNHPLVPRFHNDGRTPEGEFYYVMDYVEGRGLDVILRREGPLQPERIVRLIRQLLDVLAYAHAKGVFHRDLKPANILLIKDGTDEEEVRVLDFGIAKILSREGDFADFESMHTMEGGAIGTPHYMAPEQVTGRGKVDEKTDLYALGVIVYQMCSGRVPFTGKTSMEVAAARLTQAPPPLDEDTPEWLRGLVMSLLERQQEKRPGTQALRAGLEQLVVGQRGLRRSLGFIGAGIVAIGLGVAWMLYESGRDKALPPVVVPPASGATRPEARIWPAIHVQAPVDDQRVSDPRIEVVVLAKGHERVRIGEQEVAVDPDGFARTTVTVASDARTAIVVRAEDGSELARRHVRVDTTPPRLSVDRPEGVSESRGSWVTDRTELEVVGRVDDGEQGALAARPVDIVGAELVEVDADGTFRARLRLDEGMHTLEVQGRDAVGLNATPFTRTLHVDLSPPRVILDPGPSTTQADRVSLVGRIEDRSECRATVHRAGDPGEPQELTLGSAGQFAHEVQLALGSNTFRIEARDVLGHSSREDFTIERTTVLAAVTSIEPGSGHRYSAAVEHAKLFARTNLRVSRLLATRAGRPIEVEFVPDEQGFSARLPLDWGDNDYRLVPHDERDVEGTAFELTYVRERPPVPHGCALPADVEIDALGRPTAVTHTRSGLSLRLVGGGMRAGREVQPFYIGGTEVTIGELRRWRPDFYSEPEARPAFWGEIASDRERHPATQVSFEVARAFCSELGLRLPTTSEWELAGMGEDGRAFPWGDDERALACNADDPADGWPRTAPVASFPLDRSPWGVHDLAGNVSEWCEADSGGRPALRGGSWFSELSGCRLDQQRQSSGSGSDTIGFRVALDAPQSFQ